MQDNETSDPHTRGLASNRSVESIWVKNSRNGKPLVVCHSTCMWLALLVEELQPHVVALVLVKLGERHTPPGIGDGFWGDHENQASILANFT